MTFQELGWVVSNLHLAGLGTTSGSHRESMFRLHYAQLRGVHEFTDDILALKCTQHLTAVDEAGFGDQTFYSTLKQLPKYLLYLELFNFNVTLSDHFFV